jgi:hypothetical protein
MRFIPFWIVTPLRLYWVKYRDGILTIQRFWYWVMEYTPYFPLKEVLWLNGCNFLLYHHELWIDAFMWMYLHEIHSKKDREEMRQRKEANNEIKRDTGIGRREERVG